MKGNKKGKGRERDGTRIWKGSKREERENPVRVI